LDLKESGGGTTLRIRVRPRASEDAVLGEREGALLVRLTAAPVDGLANAALLRVIAEAFGLPLGGVSLLRGTRGRDKWVRLEGMRAVDVLDRVSSLSKDEP
jgi:uncharacterized protein